LSAKRNTAVHSGNRVPPTGVFCGPCALTLARTYATLHYTYGGSF